MANLQHSICSTIKIFIDNGQGWNTVGKRSPDGQFLEYYYNRIVARRATTKLQALGLNAEFLTPEEGDISLEKRCRRVNAWCRVHGKVNAICVSIHFKAYGNRWYGLPGWSIYTAVGNTAADNLADCIDKAAAVLLPSMKLRGECSDGDIDYEWRTLHPLKSISLRVFCICLLFLYFTNLKKSVDYLFISTQTTI